MVWQIDGARLSARSQRLVSKCIALLRSNVTQEEYYLQRQSSNGSRAVVGSKSTRSSLNRIVSTHSVDKRKKHHFQLESGVTQVLRTGSMLTLRDVRRCWMSPDSADHTPGALAAWRT